MKLRNLMLVALLAPTTLPVVAKPMVTYGTDAVAQTSGGTTGGSGETKQDTQAKKKPTKGKKKPADTSKK